MDYDCIHLFIVLIFFTSKIQLYELYSPHYFAIHCTKAALCKLLSLFLQLAPSSTLSYFYNPQSLISPTWLSPAVLLGPLSTQTPCVISLSTCQWKRDLFNVFEEQTTRSLKTLSPGVWGAVCVFAFFIVSLHQAKDHVCLTPITFQSHAPVAASTKSA